MTGFIRSHYVHVGTTATAAIVALGLVTVPPARYDSVIARTEFAAVQLQAAAVSTAVAAVENNLPHSAAASASTATAAPQAAATSPSDILAGIGDVAFYVAFAALWWLAFPVTIPASVYASAYGLGVFLYGPGPGFSPITLPDILKGLAEFVVGPIKSIIDSISSLLNPTSSLQNPTEPLEPLPASARRSARSAAAITQVRADAVGAGETAVTDPASAAETTPPIATQTRTRRSPARLSSRAAAQPAASATVVATKAAAATAKPAAAQRSARGAAHRAERSVANATG